MKRRIGIGVELDALLRGLDESVELLADRAGASQQGWSPAVDLFERDGETVVTVNLPGTDPNTLAVVVDHDSVIISGNKERGTDARGRRYHLVERPYGPFEISIRLRREPDPAACRARLLYGVLEVTVLYAPRKRDRTVIPIEREVQ